MGRTFTNKGDSMIGIAGRRMWIVVLVLASASSARADKPVYRGRHNGMSVKMTLDLIQGGGAPRDGDTFWINGETSNSRFKAHCTLRGTQTRSRIGASCDMTGDRHSDRKSYQGTARLTVFDSGDRIDYSYTIKYDNGQKVSATYTLRRDRPVPPPPPPAPAGSSPSKPVPCSATSNMRSSRGTGSTRVTFVSASDQPLRAYWIDYTGNRKFYKTIPARGRWEVGSFLTHVWTFERPNGTCYRTLILGSADRTVRL